MDAHIAQLPGGSLFPDDLAQKLITYYDQDGDGLLQKSEFAPTEEIGTQLEKLFREKQEGEHQAQLLEREIQEGDKMKSKAVTVVPPEGFNDGPASVADKALSALPYVLPLADSMSFAGHLFAAFPEQTAWAQPIALALLALRSLPFATLILFFGLSTLSSNPKINKLVRFNMQQAINLDIALVVPGLMGTVILSSLGQDAYKLGSLSASGSDVVFVGMLLAVAYSVASSAVGSFPNKLPLIGRLNRENPKTGND